jgi:hypothetical protein
MVAPALCASAAAREAARVAFVAGMERFEEKMGDGDNTEKRMQVVAGATKTIITTAYKAAKEEVKNEETYAETAQLQRDMRKELQQMVGETSEALECGELREAVPEVLRLEVGGVLGKVGHKI